jgi:hypothetical protein
MGGRGFVMCELSGVFIPRKTSAMGEFDVDVEGGVGGENVIGGSEAIVVPRW